MSNTYGTGVSPGKQTINDIAGLVNLGGERKDPIDYKPRPPITAPPASAALPTPGKAVASAGGDWPVDPDAANKARKVAAGKVPHTGNASVDALYEPDGDLPLPRRNDPELMKESSMTASQLAQSGTKEQDEKVRKLMADAKAGASVDANGNPIRKTLSEPPVVYRAPDPNAPTEFKAVKKTHWPWQKAAPDDAKPALSDDSADASASATKSTQ